MGTEAPYNVQGNDNEFVTINNEPPPPHQSLTTLCPPPHKQTHKYHHIPHWLRVRQMEYCECKYLKSFS